jgi:hypothetical protein
VIDSIIRNGLGNKIAAEVTDAHALKVATTEYTDLDTAVNVFLNPTYGANMAINAAPVGGSTINIHDGEEHTYWTASSIAGIWDFSSGVQAHDSTASIDGTLTVNNDVAQFAKGSVLNLTTYSQISGWIYVTSWSDLGGKEINIYGWDTATSLQVGLMANIGNYIDSNKLNIWQKFVIPLSDMSLYQDLIDAFRLDIVEEGAGEAINFYLDNIVLEGGGASVQEYIVAPQAGQKFHVSRINLLIIDDYDSTLVNATMPKLSYDKLLGETFTTGIIFRVIINKNITFAVQIRNISDILMLPTIENFNTFSDGANTGLQFSFTFPVDLEIDSRTEDKLSILLTENFSGLLQMGATVASKLEAV